jgi:four helix bundle protein
VQDFKRLIVWHKAHALLLAVNETFTPAACRSAPWLRSQVLRAAASISANIAEGCGKTSAREFVRFIDISIGSSRELENHLLVARDTKILSLARFHRLDAQLTEVRRMLIGLARAIRNQPPKP